MLLGSLDKQRFLGEYGAASAAKSATNVFLIAVGLIPRSLLRKVFTGAGENVVYGTDQKMTRAKTQSTPSSEN